jgi:hypothetical protein
MNGGGVNVRVGGIYSTRNGSVATITGMGSGYPEYWDWVGKVESGGSVFPGLLWTENGRFLTGNQESPYDLMEELSERRNQPLQEWF